MSRLIQLPVLIAGLQTKVDGSVKITLETRELENDYAGQLYGMRNAEAWCVISANEIKEPNIPRQAADPELTSKTPSQRLRAVIFVYWQQKGSTQDFDTFYKQRLESIIDQYKGKLA